jgi:hypothetical protein
VKACFGLSVREHVHVTGERLAHGDPRCEVGGIEATRHGGHRPFILAETRCPTV